jgi:hypothetical protein
MDLVDPALTEACFANLAESDLPQQNHERRCVPHPAMALTSEEKSNETDRISQAPAFLEP